MEMKIKSVENEIIELNNKFHKQLLIDKSFYEQLMKNGFTYNHCILISIVPDSNNTYIGKIIKQDGSVLEFDIDLNSAENSLWIDVTKNFLEIYKKNELVKPWLREVVAYKLFNYSVPSSCPPT